MNLTENEIRRLRNLGHLLEAKNMTIEGVDG